MDYGTNQNELEPPGTIWNKLDKARMRQNQQRTEEEKAQKIDRGIICLQYHQPTKWNFTNNYCYKELHLRRW